MVTRQRILAGVALLFMVTDVSTTVLHLSAPGPDYQLATFCVDKHHGGTYRYPGDCDKFIVCANRIMHINYCPAGLYFDDVLKVCNWPYAVQCVQGEYNVTDSLPTTTRRPTARPFTTRPPTTRPFPTRPPTTRPIPTHSPPVTPLGPKCQRRVCYYTNWSQKRPEKFKFKPENINAEICTHIIYAFARLTENGVLEPYEWNDDDTKWSEGMYSRVIAKKREKPELKVLLATGGWKMGSVVFSRMVATARSRSHFVSTTIDFLRARGFDGLDLDWEYPARRGGIPEDKDRFTKLCQELRYAFEQEGKLKNRERLLLTAAVAASKSTIDVAYDIPAISVSLDFINLMSYDYHGSFDGELGHNSPLYKADHETGNATYLNLDFSANYWVKMGCPRDKLVIGLPLYGRSFTMTTSQAGLGAPATAGRAGLYTKAPGFLAYPEVCSMIYRYGAEVRYLKDQRVPYLVHGDQWVGYDSPSSLKEKVRYVRKHGFGGIMVWSLDLDDFKGLDCGGAHWPLMRAIDHGCTKPDLARSPYPWMIY